MDGPGRATGRGRATTRIDGTDVQLDLDVRVTVEPGAEVDVDDEAERIPAFATPLPIVQASAPAAPPPAPAPSPALADFRVEGMRVVLRENLVLELTDGSGAREVVDLRRIDPEVREAFLEGAARVAVAGKRGAARLVSRAPSVPAAEDDCPEKRRAREVGEAVARMALEGDGDAGRIASRVLGEIGGGFLADAISALVSDADGV
jgi:hypothetical protein